MKKAARVQGVISITSKGTGYVKVEGRDIDIEIDARHLNTALHGDTVEVILHPEVKPKRQNGEISKIISRAKMAFAGALKKTDGIFFVKPDDPKMYTDILIPEKNLDEAKEGQKVFAEIVFWQDSKLPPEGKIVKIFGRAGENEAEMHAMPEKRASPKKSGGVPKKKRKGFKGEESGRKTCDSGGTSARFSLSPLIRWTPKISTMRYLSVRYRMEILKSAFTLPTWRIT